MTEAVLAIEADLDEDLFLFSQFLWQHNINHQVNERDGKQCVYLADAKQLNFTLSVYQAFKAGALQFSKGEKLVVEKKTRGPLPYLSILLVVLSVLGGVLVAFDPLGKIYHLFTFQDFFISHGRLSFSHALKDFDGNVQLWRAFTPALLHFSVLHTVFNSLWVFELGRRIEFALGRFNLFMLVMLLAIGSNLLQFLSSPNVRFGGMSGVIYGLLGFCFLANKLRPHAQLELPVGILIFMLIWLALGFSGLFGLFGVGIANWAHLSGLIFGLLLAFGVVLMAPKTANKS